MDDLDKEIDSIVKYYETRRKKSRFKKYEQKNGETPLGGEMRLTADFMDDDWILNQTQLIVKLSC